MRQGIHIRGPAFYGALWLTAIALVIGLLRKHGLGLSIPIGFNSDGLFYQGLSGVVFREGWWFHATTLGFPFGAPFIAFPSNSNVDFAVVWAICWFAPDAPTALNLGWIVLLGLGGVGCAACLRMLGTSSLVSFVLGLLYALMPFAIYRNVGHFSLTPYLIVYPGTIALLSFDNGWERLSRGQRFLLLFGCALIGLNYIYFAFFSCIVLAIAAIARSFRVGKAEWFSPATAGLILILIATVINLAPSILEWYRHGVSPNVRYKMPQEFDFYGLKLRQLLTPLWEHPFPPFKKWLAMDYEADFPLETENMTTRLGVVASVGFLLVLAAPLAGDRAWPLAQRALGRGTSALTVALILYAVIGGLGSLFNLLVAPEIRAPNRVAPFLYFFALAAVAFQLDRLGANGLRRANRQWMRLLAVAVVALVGVLDQVNAFAGLNRMRASSRAEAAELKSFVEHIEVASKGSAAIFQLPFTEFLNDNGENRMGPYDHFRPTVYSANLRWSYPSMSPRSQLWTAYARTLSVAQLTTFLRASGFDHLWLDRFGFVDDTEENTLRRVIGNPQFESPSMRYALFDLGRPASVVDDPAIARAAHALLAADLRLEFGRGFYNPEHVGRSLLRWSKRESMLEVSNHGDRTAHIELRAKFQSLVPGPVRLRVDFPGGETEFSLTNQPQTQVLPLSLAPGVKATITMVQIDDSFSLPNDRRQLYFGVIDPYVVFVAD